MSLPTTEARITDALLQNAAELAREGQLAAGYTLVWTGLQRARIFAKLGEPWADSLLQQWERELERYCHEFGVRTGDE